MEIKIICEATEQVALKKQINTNNIFSICDDCLVIDFCDEDENVISQSEISIEDAKKLAKLLLNI